VAVPGVFRHVEGGIEIFLRLTPRAARETLGSVWSGQGKTYLVAHVRAVPADGKANSALLDLLARELAVPRSTLALASGHTARLKTVRLQAEGLALERAISTLHKRQA
jgi:hypothetical protein